MPRKINQMLSLNKSKRLLLLPLLIFVVVTGISMLNAGHASAYTINCPEFLCSYFPGGYNYVGGCATNCPDTGAGFTNSATGYDQPVLQDLTDTTHNFYTANTINKNPGDPPVTLQLGYNSQLPPNNGGTIVTWANLDVTGSGPTFSFSTSSPTLNGGRYFYPCVATPSNTTSPYFGTSGAVCNPGEQAVVWADSPGSKISRKQLTINIPASVSGVISVCLRTHISVAPPGSSPTGSAAAVDFYYSQLNGIMGASRNTSPSGPPLCIRVAPPTVSPPPPPPPTTVETPPTISLSASCDGAVDLFNVGDPNDTGGGVYYYGVIYRLDASGNPRVDGSQVAYSGRIYGYSTLHIPWPPPDNTDYGWSAQFGVSNVRASDGGDDAWPAVPPDVQRLNTPPCYQATCTVHVNGNVPGGGSSDVQANMPFTVNVAMYNTGPGTLPANLAGYNLSVVGSIAPPFVGTPYAMGATIPPGGAAFKTLTFRAPANVANKTIVMYPAYYGLFRIGPTCSDAATGNPGGGNFRVYQPFTLRPDASSVPTPPTGVENASGADYKTWASSIDRRTTVQVYAPSVSQFGVIPAGGVFMAKVTKPGGTFGPGGPPPYELNCTATSPPPCNYPIPASALKAGDQYCAIIYLTNYSSGYVGPGGPRDIIPSIPPVRSDSRLKCFTVKNEPFFRAYGAGVSSGGDFAGVPCVGNGLLGGWNSFNGATSFGSGADLSAEALGSITGFASAQDTHMGPSPIGLTFANRAGLPPGNFSTSVDSPRLGGDFQYGPPGTTHCITPPLAPTTGTTSIGGGGNFTINPPKNGAYSGAGQLTIHSAGPALKPNQNISIFNAGDVYIKDNITYDTAMPWGSGLVPSFVLVATGNIYIDKDVQQLDGIYTTTGPGKKIYTCSTKVGPTFKPVDILNIYTDCKKQLTVFGSFQASQINLMRTYGSLRDAAGAVPPNCSNDPLGTGKISSRPTCAAEVFDFSPEMFLSNQAINPPSNGATTYDAITGLPPVVQ